MTEKKKSQKQINELVLFCRECVEKMSYVKRGMGIAFLSETEILMYCNNDKCKKYGYVTVGGVKL